MKSSAQAVEGGSVATYFHSLGCSETQLASMLLRLPHVVDMSLEDNIVPAVQFLQEDVGLDKQDVPSVIARCVLSAVTTM